MLEAGSCACRIKPTLALPLAAMMCRCCRQACRHLRLYPACRDAPQGSLVLSAACLHRRDIRATSPGVGGRRDECGCLIPGCPVIVSAASWPARLPLAALCRPQTLLVQPAAATLQQLELGHAAAAQACACLFFLGTLHTLMVFNTEHGHLALVYSHLKTAQCCEHAPAGRGSAAPS